jgi:hypothetical protein
MRIQTFNNKKGLIYGSDSKRISCDKEGVLKIGTAEISIVPDEESIMPVLFNGCTGTYKATFTEKNGDTYELEKVTVRGGRIEPPPPIAVELMELRVRAEALEAKCDALERENHRLNNIFDTNALNFLIK